MTIIMGKLRHARCIVCGRPFQTRHPNATTCPPGPYELRSPCRMENERRQKASYAERIKGRRRR